MKYESERRFAAAGGPGLGEDLPNPANEGFPAPDVSRRPLESESGIDEELWHEELFQHPRDDADEWEWPESPEAVLAWNAGRTRRMFVELVAWASVASLLGSLLAASAMDSRLCAAVTYWATMGLLGDSCPSAHTVLENARDPERTKP